MAESIALSFGIRSSLRQMQVATGGISASELRLATGLRVNSALDGSPYFAAVSLRSRAADILAFKEEQNHSISTIKAADTAAASIDSLIQQARTLAITARGSADGFVDPAVRQSLATQFDKVLKQINGIASDAWVRDSRLTTGRDSTASATWNAIAGLADARATNVVKASNYSVGVNGTGRISIREGDVSNAQETLGVSNFRVTGFSSVADGGFSDLDIQIVGRAENDRTITISDGTSAISKKISYAALAQGTQHFEASLNTGARVDFDLDKATLDAKVGQDNSVGITVRKQVDLAVKITDARTQQQIIRSGNGDDNRLSSGANGFRFDTGTLRMNVDGALLNKSATRNGPTISDAYGAAANALADAIRLQGTPAAEADDQNYTLAISGTGLNTATATVDVAQSNVAAAAQINQFTAAGLAFGQSATVTVDGTPYSTTAGAGGLTADQVAANLSGLMSGAGMQITTGGSLPGNVFNLTGATGTAMAVGVSGGVSAGQLQSAVSPVAQITDVGFTPTVELGEDYSVTIDGQTFTHTSVNGDTVSTIVSSLAQLISPSGGGGSSSVTASVVNGGLRLTAQTPGTGFNTDANVNNLPLHLDATLSNGTAAQSLSLPVQSGPFTSTFNAAYGNGITGVALTLDNEQLRQAALNQYSLKFDVRFAQQGEGTQVDVATTASAAGRGDLNVHLASTPGSTYLVKARNLYNDGLGLDYATNDWRDLDDIEQSIADCDKASSRLRDARASFTTDLGIIKTWNTHTDDYSNVIQEGANKLTLVDQNEEGVTLLAWQTRYAIAQTSLSIANAQSSSFLKLFAG